MLNSRFGYSMKKNSFKGLNIDCIQYSNIIRITYYSYSYSGTILNPNIIRIRIRPNICARILFVFVFAHFEKTNNILIRIRSKFWFRIIFVFVFGPKKSIRSPLVLKRPDGPWWWSRQGCCADLFFSSVCPLFLSRLGLICRSFFLLFLFIRFWTFMEAVMICSSFFFSNWLSISKHEARCTYNEWPCWFVIYKLTKVFSLKIAKHVYGADKGTCEPQKHWTWFCIVLAFQGAGNILLIGFSLCYRSAPWLMHQCSSFCS